MLKLFKKSILLIMLVIIALLSSTAVFAVTAEEEGVYTISYELNKGENNPSNPDTYTKGQTVTFADPTRAYHTFKGWYLDSSFKTPVTEINSETEGNLKLYAKWYLEGLNRNGEGAEDMIWSWWYYPQVVSSGNNVFYGYSTSEGFCGVAKYNSETGKTERTDLKCILPVDDHNGLAVTEMDDGRIMCAYAGGHNNNNEIHIRISENPGDISNFSKHIILESAGKTCYSQILRYKGDYYVFYRVNNHSWAYRSSPDGESWGSETILIKTTMQYYCRFMPTTKDGLFRVCMYSNPREADPNIRMGFFDAESKALLNADGKTKVGTSRVSQEKFKILIACPEGSRQRMFDVAITEPERPLILYTVFTSANKANDSVYYLYDNGETYKVCDGGIPIMSNNYQCGAAFAGKHQLVTIRNADAKDIVELYDYSDDGISLQKTIYAKETGDNHHRNGRPIVDINGKVFVWHEGYYNPAKYTEFLTSARLSSEFFDGTTEDTILHINCDKNTRGFTLTERKGGCTTEGYEVYTCQCSASYIKQISASGHSYKRTVVAPTCTKKGYTDVRCYCGDGYTENEIEATGHTEAIMPAAEATCSSVGLTEGKKCSVCNEVLSAQKEIPMLPHTEVVKEGRAPTCTEIGFTDGKMCSVCKKMTVDNEKIDALGHKKEALTGKEATCTEDGLTEGEKCSVCNEVLKKQEIISATGHKETAIPEIKATCSTDGSKDGKKCEVCGIITEEPVSVPALGHTEVILPKRSATYKQDGLTEGKKCSVCEKITKAQEKISRKKLKKVTGVKVKKTTTSSVTLSWKKVTGAESYKVYYTANGKKWKSVKTTKTTLTVKKLTSGKSYKFKVKAFADKYYGPISNAVSTATRVKKVSLSSLKSSKVGQTAVSWKTATGASGYVVEYSTSKKFTKKTTKTVVLKKGSAKKTTLKALESGKKYYVRVRAYKVVNGKKVYGSYSSIKSVTVK